MNKLKFLFLFLAGLGGFVFLSLPKTVLAATLTLSPSSQTVTVNNTFTVSIMLDTTGQSVYGVDVYSLRYDPTALEVQDAIAGTAGIQIQPGTLMTDVQYNTVNTTAGTIQFSQTASTASGNYNGSGVLATVTFKALKTGTATLTFDFTPGSTTDTNVATLYNDVLTSVGSGSYTVNAASDTTAPSVPTNVAATANSSSAITVSWTASTDPTVSGQATSGVAGYRIYRGGIQVATSTTASFNNTGLSAGTSYTYTVAAYDNAGNVSAQSSPASATTQNGADATPPTVPASINATVISTSQVNLTWSVSTDPTVAGQTTSGLAGYRVFRGGVQIATTTAAAYNNTGLAAATTYSYSVAAYDNAGNSSAQGSPVSVTTQSNPDTTAPTASVSSPGSGASLTGSVTFSASASDPSVAGQVTSGLALLTLSIDGNIYATTTSGSLSVVVDTSQLTNASHTFSASARDNAGNTSALSSVTATVFNLSTATRYPRKVSLSSLEGVSSISSDPTLTVRLLSPATGSVLDTQTLAADASHQYTVNFSTSLPQVVDARISAAGYLSRKLNTIDTTLNSASVLAVSQLLAGDFNSDNSINSLDYSVLNTHWLQNFAQADINQDALVNSLDYAILKNNWARTGE